MLGRSILIIPVPSNEKRRIPKRKKMLDHFECDRGSACLATMSLYFIIFIQMFAEGRILSDHCSIFPHLEAFAMNDRRTGFIVFSL